MWFAHGRIRFLDSLDWDGLQGEKDGREAIFTERYGSEKILLTTDTLVMYNSICQFTNVTFEMIVHQPSRSCQ